MVREQVYLEAEFGSAFHVCQPEVVGSVFGFAYAAKLKSKWQKLRVLNQLAGSQKPSLIDWLAERGSGSVTTSQGSGTQAGLGSYKICSFI